MEKLNVKTGRVLIYTIIAITAAVVLRQIGLLTEGPVEWACGILRSCIYIVMFLLWGVSVRRRLIQPQVRRYLTAVSLLMVFWMTVRTIRHLFTEDPWVLRSLWYMYYLPMLFIPLLALFVALSLGKPESFILPKPTRLLYLPAGALLLLVLTNDLHQLVFDFPDTALIWANDYSYGAGYLLVVGWELMCALTALITMIIKCRVPGSRRVMVLPFVPILLALIYGELYIFHHRLIEPFAADMTPVFCLLFASAFECCIKCGLIQTNTGYEKLFEIGTIGARITDEDYNTRYASANAAELSREIMKEAEKGSVSLDKDTLLKSSPVRGGHVLWQEDISDITALLETLEENRKNIEESNSIEEENYRTKLKINTVREKNRLYDRLQEQTAGQIELIDGLLNRYEEEKDPEASRKLLARTGLIGTYIKRRGNLIFIEEKSEITDTSELAACLEESFAGLKIMDVDCALDIPEGEMIAVGDAVRVYDLFERAIETAVDDLRSVWMKSRVLEDAVVFYTEVETGKDLSQAAVQADSAVQEEGVWRFTLRIEKAGETA